MGIQVAWQTLLLPSHHALFQLRSVEHIGHESCARDAYLTPVSSQKKRDKEQSGLSLAHSRIGAALPLLLAFSLFLLFFSCSMAASTTAGFALSIDAKPVLNSSYSGFDFKVSPLFFWQTHYLCANTLPCPQILQTTPFFLGLSL